MSRAMNKALLYLDEDLASSMALRFAAEHAGELGLILQPFHVADEEGRSPENLGWANLSLEKALLAGGLDKVNRLIRTENIDRYRACEPKVVLGDRNRETLRELTDGGYSLYVEGYVGRQDTADFVRLLAGPRFRNSPCPILLVKHLVAHRQLILLLDRNTNVAGVISGMSGLYGEAAGNIDLTVIFYRSAESGELVFQERKKRASLDLAEAMLAEKGWPEPEWLVVESPPDLMAGYLRGHGLVAAPCPESSDERARLLASLANPVLLFPEEQA